MKKKSVKPTSKWMIVKLCGSKDLNDNIRPGFSDSEKLLEKFISVDGKLTIGLLIKELKTNRKTVLVQFRLEI